MSLQKRLNLQDKELTLETFSWYSDNENILVRMLPKNRAALLNERKSTNRSHCFKCNRHNFSKQDLDLLKNKMDEANFENILTAELYTVNLNGSKKLFKSADMYAGENFSLMEIT
jgi:hypothetical protein